MDKNPFLLYKTLIIGIIILFVSMSVVTSTEIIIEKPYISIIYSPHDPIYINGNDDFTNENGVTGGSGKSYDPYIIEDWKIDASSQDGITIRNVTVYFKIRNCYIHEGDVKNDGIVFINVEHGEIEGTIITGNRYGIIFRTQHPGKENSSKNSIHHNTISNNIKDAIHFQHTGWGHHSHNLIFLNEISNNNQGIYMVMSAYNQIFSNHIISNTRWGVNLTMCMGGGKNNKVYHNNFINNGNENGQACVLWTLENDWDDGYPSGGNYWSDYNGLDEYSGPDQNIPGSDGIGDTPYEIYTYDGYENEYDYYPLMEPFGGNLPPFAEFTWTPTLPDPGEMVLFNASESIDYDGYIMLYEWDWNDDGVFDENHTIPTANHTFENAGYYPVTLTITDNESEKDTITKTVRVGNQPPDAPTIDGPMKVKIGEDNEYTFYAFDPDGDDVSFIIDWDLGDITGWLDYVESGTEIKLKHNWSVRGVYKIQCRVKDVFGLESKTTTFFVEVIKRSRQTIQFLWFNWFLEHFPMLVRLLNLLK